MSIKKKIQQSMTVILTVTLVLAYVILSVILYNRNMNSASDRSKTGSGIYS